MAKNIDSLKKLKKAIREVPIEEAAEIRSGALDLRRKGRQIFGLCPFHSDERQGNFAFGGPHNGFKCFACGESGDIINLVMKLDDVSFKEALLKIAVELDLLTQAQADTFGKGESPAQIKQRKNTRKFSAEQNRTLSQLEVEKRHAVYSLLAEGDAVINPIAKELGLEGNQSRLSPEHYEQLKTERGLTDEQIEEAGFFTLREDYRYLHAIYLRLFQDYRYEPNTMQVPGFFRHKNVPCIDKMHLPSGEVFDFELHNYGEQYYWFFEPVDALGIPIRNEDGFIVAIQLRPDDSSMGGKYIWLSSTFADGNNGRIDGSSPGAQPDIMIPADSNRSYLFITEGKFKSLAITDTFNVPSISLQGVNTYQGVKESVEKISNQQEKSIDTVFVAFDADLAFNNAVMKSVIDMSEKELGDYDVYIAVWDHTLGKGIDDLYQNGHHDAIVRIGLDEMISIKDELNDRYPMKMDADKADIKRWREEYFYAWMLERHPEMPTGTERRVLA